MLSEIIVTAERENMRELEFVAKSFSPFQHESISLCDYKNTAKITVVIKDLDNAVNLYNIVATAAILFEKYKIITEYIKVSESLKLEYGCLIGSILSIGLSDEIKMARDYFDGKTILSPAAFSRFFIPSIISKWKSLGEFTRRMRGECNTGDDLIDLSLFFMALDGEKAVNIRLGREYFKFGNVLYAIPGFCNDREVNTLISITAAKPLTVTIEKPSEHSEGFMDIVRGLGV